MHDFCCAYLERQYMNYQNTPLILVPGGKIVLSVDRYTVHNMPDLITVGCVTGYQVIRVIRIFAKTYPFE